MYLMHTCMSKGKNYAQLYSASIEDLQTDVKTLSSQPDTYAFQGRTNYPISPIVQSKILESKVWLLRIMAIKTKS